MNTDTTRLLQEAAEWRLLSLLFESPGDGWHVQIAALAHEISDPELQSAAALAAEQAGAGLYHSTFGPGGPAAPREVSYRENMLAGPLLGELSASYRAFAYEPALDEPPDHMAVEVGFLAYLRLKQAYAQTCDDMEQAAVAAEAAEWFIQDHLRNLAEPLARSLDESGITYLAHAAAALLRRVGPRPDASSAPAPSPVACPVQGQCAWLDEEP